MRGGVAGCGGHAIEKAALALPSAPRLGAPGAQTGPSNSQGAATQLKHALGGRPDQREAPGRAYRRAGRRGQRATRPRRAPRPSSFFHACLRPGLPASALAIARPGRAWGQVVPPWAGGTGDEAGLCIGPRGAPQGRARDAGAIRRKKTRAHILRPRGARHARPLFPLPPHVTHRRAGPRQTPPLVRVCVGLCGECGARRPGQKKKFTVWETSRWGDAGHSLVFFSRAPRSLPKKMTSSGLQPHFLKNDDLSSLLIPDSGQALTATKGELQGVSGVGGRRAGWREEGEGRASTSSAALVLVPPAHWPPPQSTAGRLQAGPAPPRPMHPRSGAGQRVGQA